MESLGSHPGYSDVRQWAWQPQPARLDAPAAAGLLETRQSRRPPAAPSMATCARSKPNEPPALAPTTPGAPAPLCLALYAFQRGQSFPHVFGGNPLLRESMGCPIKAFGHDGILYFSTALESRTTGNVRCPKARCLKSECVFIWTFRGVSRQVHRFLRLGIEQMNCLGVKCQPDRPAGRRAPA